MNKEQARVLLRKHGYCPNHLIPLVRDYHAGDSTPYCHECLSEAKRAADAEIAEAIAVLKAEGER